MPFATGDVPRSGRAYARFVRKRWDTDVRGAGVAGGGVAVSALDELRTALLAPDWVAEEPEIHLLPHLERAATGLGYGITSDLVGPGHLRVRIDGAPQTAGERRHLAYLLIAAIAESNTAVEERIGPDATDYLIATGLVRDDQPFAPHGHLLTITLVPRR
jgi:hypothetical protein